MPYSFCRRVRVFIASIYFNNNNYFLEMLQICNLWFSSTYKPATEICFKVII
jgi:hypothetical protein